MPSGSSFYVSHLRLFRAIFAHDRRPDQLNQFLGKLSSNCGRFWANCSALSKMYRLQGVAPFHERGKGRTTVTTRAAINDREGPSRTCVERDPIVEPLTRREWPLFPGRLYTDRHLPSLSSGHLAFLNRKNRAAFSKIARVSRRNRNSTCLAYHLYSCSTLCSIR